MAGEDLKKAGEGNKGSTAGLRFNPREAPEFMEEDRTLAREEPEDKQLQEEKKQKEKEERHKKIAGLQHLSVKVVGKKKPRGDNQRNDEKLSEMTGPASSTGYPLDLATGAKTGGGSVMGGNPVNIMTGHSMAEGLDILRKKKSSSDKGVKGRHGKSEDIHSLRTRSRRRETAKRRGKMGQTSLSRIYGAKDMVRGTRNPKGYTETRKTLAERTTAGRKGAMRRGHGGRTKGWRQKAGGKTKREQTPDPRSVAASVETSQAARDIPTHTSPYNLSSMQAYENVMKPPAKGPRIEHPHQTASDLTPATGRQVNRPGVARSVGGHEISATGGPADGMTGFQPAAIAQSFDRLEEYEYLLKKAKLSDADLTEFKWLVREMRRLLRSGALKKAGLDDSEHDDERPTPNSHRKTTSHPTGATEVDPDDDPRFWGAHPIGLLLPRRGHQ